jgi:polyisoprenyl-phosphate glycosyltransferase
MIIDMKSIAIVVPCYNEEEVLEIFFNKIQVELKYLNYFFNIIFVDDGSVDNTWEKITSFKGSTKLHIKGVRLARNSGHAVALQAGYEYAETLKVNAVISMDADLQHPIEKIPDFIAKWELGNQLVKGIRLETDGVSFFKNKLSILFYKNINKFSQLKMKNGEADYRLIDITLLSKINALPEHPKFYRGLFSLFHNNIDVVEFIAGTRAAGSSKYTIGKMLELARIAFISFSEFPLRLISVFGLIICGASFIGLLFSLILKIVMGYAFVSNVMLVALFITLMLGVILTLIGILALYFIDITRQIRGRPAYWKEEEL